MSRSILKININNELDVVLAYKRAKQLSERLGITIANQTKFATAVSEICRNVVEHVGSGTIQFALIEVQSINYIEAIVSDRGRGLGNIEYLLNRNTGGSNTKGTGLINSRKLVDYFNVESEFEKGTKVTLRQRLPHNAPTVTKTVAENWMQEFDMDNVSPYAEIKRQNMQLLEVLEQLRERNEEAEQQLKEISRLNEKLQQTNESIQELLEEREEHNARLQSINEDLDTFAHTVSHDLRAPLQNINGLSHALAEYLDSARLEEAKAIFPMLRQQTARMDQFILSILSYSLAGRKNIVKTETELHQLLQGVTELLSIPEHVTIILPERPLRLQTETILLHQVFSNLIGNAIKYHDLKQGATIEVTFELKGDMIYFSLQDNGPGIPAASQGDIFTMYHTITVNSAGNSTGLGLSIVKKIVTGKGGKVWVDSEGRGTRFTFTWPASEIKQL
ncbi:sensor histidine kinase [Pontibacter sp. BT310]|uniref:histidine kinase n=1 Tax=Pontibacter populi TaxID=890055 RepID=A0ABS6XF30_9BACT|nr:MULTISPECIES: sensor histidine kinase [Pontibacter]MBJ6118956.1 sensor histidine kinase [Pontibacter sp. BT310]MBR0571384.1 sensor histidine kinase [Microvirga sp. STS03]MBW3365810.1 sensor histidine kinase [Pontibacter populi]